MSSDTMIWLSSCMWAKASFTSGSEKGSGLSRLMDSITLFRPTDWAWEALKTSRSAALNAFNLGEKQSPSETKYKLFFSLPSHGYHSP